MSKVKSTARSTSKKLMYASAVHKRKQLQLNQKYIYILQDQNNINCLYVLSKIYTYKLYNSKFIGKCIYNNGCEV